MPWLWRCFPPLLGLLILLFCAPRMLADVPPWLPRYDLDMHVDIDHHELRVRETVTWTNRHQRPAAELVFNAHSHYQVPQGHLSNEYLTLAKTLELLRMSPSDSIEARQDPPLQVQRVRLGEAELHFYYQEANNTALVVPLPKPVNQGESVTIIIDFSLRLPQKQGRWGQWKGVTFLANWLPVVAVYDECGWQPTPFIPWHQPFFNEAGIYTVRVTLPCDQKIASTSTARATKELGNGWKEVELSPRCSRDFAFLCSARYEEYVEQVGPVTLRCLAFPEHEFHARGMLRAVREALPVYNQWFGEFPFPDFTIAESFFGWLGNECGGLVMIDERVFGMPHIADGYVEYLMSHEFCHQWWYNIIGTNGYCETWMDEAMATHFSHRLINRKHGKNTLLHYPHGMEWLPNIRRENYRYYGLYGVVGRGEQGPTVQEMPKYKHLVNLLSMCYDRGGKIVGMIEDRLGEQAFYDFIRRIYKRYQYRILRVADFQRELAEYTGQPECWEKFFKDWLYGAGMVDWSVERVKITPLSRSWVPDCDAQNTGKGPLEKGKGRLYKATVILHQKAEYDEQTVLGISLDGSDNFQIRIPIVPDADVLKLPDPPATVETLPDHRVRVEVELPCKPTQIAVDPDQVLVDRNPANNYWKPRIRWRFAPINSMVEETDVANDYDKWNVIIGPGFWGPSYNDPWYTRSTVVGARAALFRTQEFSGGAYVGYRTDDRDVVAGVDGLWDHWPWPHTQVGFALERSLTATGRDDRLGDRGVVFGRYVFQYGSSMYLPPMHYVELFGTFLDHNLPIPKRVIPGADHFDHQTAAGVHYHLDLLTPYWDPEKYFRFDATYASGFPICGEEEAFNRADAQFSFVKGLPECLGPLSETRLAGRIFGAVGLPNKGEYFALGGGEMFRGFDLAERQGSLVYIGSLEWRVPLVRRVSWDCCDHIAGLRNVYVAPFYDVGNAYVNGHQLGPVAHAVGVGLRLDIAWFSFIERTMLRFDLAKTLNSAAPWQFWFGIQHPF